MISSTNYISGHFDFEGDELIIRFRSDESTKRPGFVISGQQLPCAEPPPVQAPLNQSPPGRIGNQPQSTSSQPTTRTTSPPPTSIGTPTSNQTDDDITYIFSVLDRLPPQRERDEGAEGRNMSVEDDFSELDFGLGTFRQADDDHTNADQNIPGSPDFNPFTGEGLTPTLPTTPTDIPTFPTEFPTIGSDFPTIPTNFPTNPTDFPTTVTFPPTSDFPVLANLDCDQLITDVTAVIESPNYPSNYPDSVNCAYSVGRASQDVCRVSMCSEE